MSSYRYLASYFALVGVLVGALGVVGGVYGAQSGPMIIDSLSYAGNSEISSSELAQDSPLKPGMAITDNTIPDEIKRVLAVYRAHGFDLALVPEIQHPSPGHVAVTIRINEQGTSGTAVPVDSGDPAPPAGVAPNGPGQ